ncbi:MAG TPA: TcpE family conjugal transfer membrane protein [Streptosporangiaceae bacterium]
MDLPTYTSIWRIEKRLYKLYDFRLPMPLPIGQVTVFAAVAVPYVVILQLLGLPFNHTLIWLYILPPGVVTWLATRPVLESKRLPELIKSQLRYLAEPAVICRMAPLAERDVMIVTGRVWRPRTRRAPEAGLTAALEAGPAETGPAESVPADEWTEPEPVAEPVVARRRRPLAPGRSRGRARAGDPEPREDFGPAEPAGPAGLALDREQIRAAGEPWAAAPVLDESVLDEPVMAVPALTAPALTEDQDRRVRPHQFRGLPVRSWRAGQAVASRPRRPEPEPEPEPVPEPEPEREPETADAGQAAEPAQTAGPAQAAEPAKAADPARTAEPEEAPEPARTAEPKEAPEPAETPAAEEQPAAGRHAAPERPAATPGPPQHLRPQVTVVGRGGAAPAVERALAGPSARRGDVRAGRVAVVPGGHRPGKPDLLQRDRSRAQLPIGGPARVVVLGCTVGAGQTMTALLTGDVLASLRADRVAVLDLNPGSGSLAKRAEARPALGQAALLGSSRLAVIAPPRPGANGPFGAAQHAPRADAELAFEAATDRYDLVLADPATVAVPRLLGLADQLVLVAPASGAAPGAVAMTFEWLEAHGRSELAAGAIMVLNGVSRRSIAHVEQAERVCAGRCRAIVRVPWDDQLQQRPPLRTPGSDAGPQRGRPHWAGVLSPGTAAAFTALAGVLVTGLAGRDPGHEPAELGQGRR